MNGATPSTLLSIRAQPVDAPLSNAVPANGNWFISPDKITLKLTKIFFGNDAGGSDIQNVDCTVTYDRSKPGLSQLGDCAFSVLPGSYTTVNLTFSSSVTYLVDDATNGIYSTATGLVTTAPAGGAQPYTLSLSSSAEMSTLMRLPAPIGVADTTSDLIVNIVVNGIHAVRATINGGTVTMGWTGTSSGNLLPDLVASVGTLSNVEYYASQALNTSGSFCAGGACANVPTGITAVSVYYASTSVPSMVGLELNGTPASCGPIGASFLNVPKAYIGIDAGGALGWALASDAAYTTYSAEMRMTRLSVLGTSTTVYCKTRSTDPAPAGGSYASGAPAINQGGNSLGSYILQAK